MSCSVSSAVARQLECVTCVECVCVRRKGRRGGVFLRASPQYRELSGWRWWSVLTRTGRCVERWWGMQAGMREQANERAHSPAAHRPHAAGQASSQSAAGCRSCGSCTETPDPGTQRDTKAGHMKHDTYKHVLDVKSRVNFLLNNAVNLRVMQLSQTLTPPPFTGCHYIWSPRITCHTSFMDLFL